MESIDNKTETSTDNKTETEFFLLLDRRKRGVIAQVPRSDLLETTNVSTVHRLFSRLGTALVDVYYESIKRELQIRPIYECRCVERQFVQAASTAFVYFFSLFFPFLKINASEGVGSKVLGRVLSLKKISFRPQAGEIHGPKRWSGDAVSH
jgi:hypothetical protein